MLKIVPKLAARLNGKPTALVVVTRSYQADDGEVVPGGKALKFYAWLRMQMVLESGQRIITIVKSAVGVQGQTLSLRNATDVSHKSSVSGDPVP